MNTLQDALKALFYSLGGAAANVRETDDIYVILSAIAALGLGAEIDAAAVKELPALPSDDGTYTLQLVMADGKPTLTWEAVSE